MILSDAIRAGYRMADTTKGRVYWIYLHAYVTRAALNECWGSKLACASWFSIWIMKPDVPIVCKLLIVLVLLDRCHTKRTVRGRLQASVLQWIALTYIQFCVVSIPINRTITRKERTTYVSYSEYQGQRKYCFFLWKLLFWTCLIFMYTYSSTWNCL